MSQVSRGAKNVVQLEVARKSGSEEEEPLSEVMGSPLYGVAMLKIAMELKSDRAASIEDIVGGVLRKMSLPEAEFREFLARNGGLLEAIAARRRY
ncbi:MAG: hypothetical protein HYZ28_09915 [Myxococcales bacterium]|nr:hypothetical protein [Myxococcales bacterium]